MGRLGKGDGKGWVGDGSLDPRNRVRVSKLGEGEDRLGMAHVVWEMDRLSLK